MDEQFTTELLARVEQIEGLNWTDVAELAGPFGIEKPESERWKDQALSIAVAEFRRDQKEVYDQKSDNTGAEPQGDQSVQDPLPAEVEDSIQSSKASDFVYVKTTAGFVCPVCQINARSGLDGSPICPANNADCPRNR